MNDPAGRLTPGGENRAGTGGAMQPAREPAASRPLSRRLQLHEDLRTRLAELCRDRGGRPVRIVSDIILARKHNRNDGGV